MNQRVMVLGATGQLGIAVMQAVPSGVEVIGYDRNTLDVTNATAVSHALQQAQPTVVINCAAYTRVDDAEHDVSTAEAVNVAAPNYIAIAARSVGARMVHVSTDYVFSGAGGAPHAPTDITDPRSVYGRTKLDGEQRVLAACPHAVIMRTAWLHAGHGQNFVRTAMRVLRERGAMDVVDDQIGTPTRAAHLAHALWLAAGTPTLRGVLHFTDAGVASWYDVAECVRETLVAAGALSAEARVTPVSSVHVSRPAPRPRCAVLDKHATWTQLGYTPPHWRVGVAASTLELL